MKDERNIPASVLARLKALAIKQNRDHNFLVTLFCRERFLYRVGVSEYKSNLILKGGLLLFSSLDSPERPTKDIDFLGRGIPADIEVLEGVVSEICKIESEDGIRFEAEGIKSMAIAGQGGYPGIRIKFKGYISSAWFPMQVDIGFGDNMSPAAVELVYPSLLDFPPPVIKAYTLESVIAEKFETMCDRGIVNSRMQDFYNLYFLAQSHGFGMIPLKEAIQGTFQTRTTTLGLDNPVFNGSLVADTTMRSRWSAYLKRPGIKQPAEDFEGVVGLLIEFLKPVVSAIVEKSKYPLYWHPEVSEWQEKLEG